MGARRGDLTEIEEKEEAEAEVEIWRYVFGFVEMGVVKCAIELGIADLVAHGSQPMTLSQLSTTLGCPPSPLYRILRFLVHNGVFKEKPITTISSQEEETQEDTKGYALTPISRRLIRNGERSLAPLLLLESSQVMLAPRQALPSRVREAREDGKLAAFEATHSSDIWEYSERNPDHSKLINDAMACDARVAVPAIVEGCPKLFEGVGTVVVVHVGGGTGTTLGMLVKNFPWLRGINFDLAHVVSTTLPCDKVDHIGGDMFHSVPKADAAFLMWVLHDWRDENCIKILKKCREAIVGDSGKVIIVEVVIEETKENKFKGAGLLLDMAMMSHTDNGKERTKEEWSYILDKAGFSRYTFTSIPTVQSIIQAYP
ncbi:LOW QUALITY PROTEIN: acetylserotonin O-methyltransferase-like [Macadamia integrifolia]|uniref:LOW QUALITY PROTEIN: acetylserotonin O-methyltransferase-like n=1 Tax=Macadamia integrifolia TaxID=60698 RepID=UPI001C4FFE9E|nr:LOW QUALITY PROTEIN: acetylserotonin O-methyltransferase-like [Macadamia integrifolia]